MIFNNAELEGVENMLVDCGIPSGLVDAVTCVLVLGNDKHGHSDATAIEHMTHATAHMVDIKRGTEIDPETGLPNQAHVVARLILAAIAAGRGVE